MRLLRVKKNYHIDPTYHWVETDDLWVGQVRLNRDFYETRTWVIGARILDGELRWLTRQLHGQQYWRTTAKLLEHYPRADLKPLEDGVTLVQTRAVAAFRWAKAGAQYGR